MYLFKLKFGEVLVEVSFAAVCRATPTEMIPSFDAPAFITECVLFKQIYFLLGNCVKVTASASLRCSSANVTNAVSGIVIPY